MAISKSSYYYTRKAVNKEDKDITIKSYIKTVYHKNKRKYGYRRITLELKNQGILINHKRVKRLMKIMGLYGIMPKAKYKSYRGDMNWTVKNLLLDEEISDINRKTVYKRNFTTTGCNQKWSTDISEFHIAAGKLYLSPILDLHNREIVSYDISASPSFIQITNMLDKAFSKYDNLEGLIISASINLVPVK